MTDFVHILAQIYERIKETPDVGIICGTGLSNLSDSIQNKIVIPYSDIKGFPHSEVAGHKSEMVFGDLEGKKVIALRGRFHFYEGWPVDQVVLGVRVMAALGVRAIVVTNAAGGLDNSFRVGDLMLIEGHISFVGMAGHNPLIGMNDETEGPRFPSVTNVYDPAFGELFAKCFEQVKTQEHKSEEYKPELRRGCYFGVAGPNYESRHEIQMMRIVGAHAVGMSTVLEVTQAAHSGIKVLGISLITNNCLGTVPSEYNVGEPNHEEVQAASKMAGNFTQTVVSRWIGQVDLSDRTPSPLAGKYSREAVATMMAARASAAAPAASSSAGICPAGAAALKAGTGGKCPVTGAVAGIKTAACGVDRCSFVAGSAVGALVAGLLLGAFTLLKKNN